MKNNKKTNIFIVIRKLWLSPKNFFYKVFTLNFRKKMLSACGKNVSIAKSVEMNWENVYIGNNVSIGRRCTFICSSAKIHIGDNVMFAQNVTLITGNHATDVIGKYMIEINENEKNKELDADILFKGDNWIGANVTILKGVIIGKGAIIGAGSLVTKNIGPYEIWAGVPAVFLKNRFTNNELIDHENQLLLRQTRNK